MKSILKLSAAAILLSCAFTVYADDQPVVVPVQMIDEQGGGIQPAVNISVAGGPPSQIMFDTGSTGLYIFASQVGSTNLRDTGHPVTYGYGDGVKYDGTLVYAPVSIGGLSTKPIPIVIVKRVYCSSEKPNCPVKNDDPNNPVAHDGFYGTMGVGMTMIPKDKVYSPMRALPGIYGQGFILQGLNEEGGELVIGLTPANTSGFNVVQLEQKGRYPDGIPMYDDKGLKVRYTIDGKSKVLTTAFDTGGNLAPHFFADGMLGMPFMPRAKIIPPNRNFEASKDNAFDWQFTTEKAFGPNQVKFKPKPPNAPAPWFNTGLGFFYDFDVMYNYAEGQLGFKAH